MFKVLIHAYYLKKGVNNFWIYTLFFYPWPFFAILKILLSFWNLVQYIFTCVFTFGCTLVIFYLWLQYFRGESDLIWIGSDTTWLYQILLTYFFVFWKLLSKSTWLKNLRGHVEWAWRLCHHPSIKHKHILCWEKHLYKSVLTAEIHRA